MEALACHQKRKTPLCSPQLSPRKHMRRGEEENNEEDVSLYPLRGHWGQLQKQLKHPLLSVSFSHKQTHTRPSLPSFLTAEFVLYIQVSTVQTGVDRLEIGQRMRRVSKRRARLTVRRDKLNFNNMHLWTNGCNRQGQSQEIRNTCVLRGSFSSVLSKLSCQKACN